MFFLQSQVFFRFSHFVTLFLKKRHFFSGVLGGVPLGKGVTEDGLNADGKEVPAFASMTTGVFRGQGG